MSLKFNPRTGEWEGTTGGVDIVELNKRQPKPEYKIEKSKEQKQQEIRDQILQNPNYAYALRLADYISKELGLKLGRSIFRNRQASCYNPETKQIYFSYENIDKSAKNGFAEYPTVGHIWANNGYKGHQERICTKSGIKFTDGTFFVKQEYANIWKFEGGKQAIWMIVLHEMAHAVQHTKNGFWRGSIHNEVFLQELEELIILFPFNEVENI